MGKEKNINVIPKKTNENSVVPCSKDQIEKSTKKPSFLHKLKTFVGTRPNAILPA